jgi:hypothetical protein
MTSQPHIKQIIAHNRPLHGIKKEMPYSYGLAEFLLISVYMYPQAASSFIEKTGGINQ